MKKTKVLIPALGILLLSTAATVSGSLAWFTANRSVTVNTNNFQVVNMNGALKRNLTAGQGTAVTGTTTDYNDGQEISPKEVSASPKVEAKLTDASYNYADGVLYTDVPKDDGTAPNEYKVCNNTATGAEAYQVEGSSEVYYAFTWTVEFVYMFQADHTSMDLFFDGASFATAGTSSATLKTREGFRIAMIPNSGTTGNKKVWLPFKDRPSTGGDVRVTGTNATTAYETGIAIYGNDAASGNQLENKAQDLVANTGRLDYLTTIAWDSGCEVEIDGKNAESKVVSYTFVAWFDGCDASVVNDADLDKVQTTMKFYVRQHA